MRIAPSEAKAIKETASAVFGARAAVRLFGSRADDAKKRTKGKKHNQAVRALGRHLIRVIWALVKSGRKYEDRSKNT